MSNLNIVNKNILTVKSGVICQAVNCQKIMNAGLAKAIRQLYPAVYQAYISKPTWELGDAQFVEVSAKDKLVVANLATQLNYGTKVRQTNYFAVKECLYKVKEYVMNNDLQVYLPYYVASNLAGGPTVWDKKVTWDEVSKIILEVIPEAIICRKN